MKRITLLLGVFILGAILVSCAPKSFPEEKPSTPVALTQEIKPTVKEAWQVEWENIQEAAKKEGKVVIYAATTGPAIKQAIGLFREKYGLALEVTSGRGGELVAKILTERANGIFMVDIFNTGMNTNAGGAKPKGVLIPLEPALILPEVIDPRGWFGGKIPWGDEERMIFMFYAYPSSAMSINTEQAKLEEINSYYDLLAPKWKGKISINDPTVAGAGFNAFSTLIYHKVLELDFFRQLIQQQPVVIRDQRLQIDWVARGKYSLALWPQPDPVAEYRRAGASVDFLPTPKEGVQLASGGGALSLVNRAPHPNAAKVFINWLLSREGQAYMQKAQELQSARVDISTEGVDPLKAREPEKKYFVGVNSMEKWLLEEQDKYLETARQTFEPLIR